jgi:hypothetical protein
MTERTVVPPPADLVVVRGEATPEEIAALVAVLLPGGENPAGAGPAQPPRAAQPSRSAWADPADRVGRPVHPGPGAWRRSSRP